MKFICINCSKEFSRKPSEKPKYCSRDCYFSAIKVAHNFKDITGKRFGRLVVIKRVGKKRSFALWLCKCDCGNFNEVTSRSLINGNSKSCGCLSREVHSKLRKGKKLPYPVWNKGLTKDIDDRVAQPWLGINRPSLSLETRIKMSNSHNERVLAGIHNFWEGGKTKLNIKIRHLLEYRFWREAIFKRDNYICQECGIRSGKLNADHIKPFALILRENEIDSLEKAKSCWELWNVNNGRTLCVSCHKKTDTYLLNIKKSLVLTAPILWNVQVNNNFRTS